MDKKPKLASFLNWDLIYKLIDYIIIFPGGWEIGFETLSKVIKEYRKYEKEFMRGIFVG